MQGKVLYGINNIYTVSVEGRALDCTIKGKILKDIDKSYAPLAPGDIVTVEADTYNSSSGLVVDRFQRRNSFSRWNDKKNAVQTMAVNIDLVVCVICPESPPFRPRFSDRVGIIAEVDGIKPLMVLNKCDQPVTRAAHERFNTYREIGYGALVCSAATGENMDCLKQAVGGKECVFVGQSGVGKSSLVNILIPEAQRKIGELSAKSNRGRHITRHSILLDNPDGGSIIDTPGIREIKLPPMNPADLTHYFPEIRPLMENCEMSVCTHRHEPGCAVYKAVDSGLILEDRYESYLRIFDSLEEMYGCP